MRVRVNGTWYFGIDDRKERGGTLPKEIEIVNHWELNEYTSLLSVLTLISLNNECNQPVWSISTTGSFTVGMFYKHLSKKEPTEENFSFRQMWKVNAAPRRAFFAWEATHRYIVTIDKLTKEVRS